MSAPKQLMRTRSNTQALVISGRKAHRRSTKITVRERRRVASQILPLSSTPLWWFSFLFFPSYIAHIHFFSYLICRKRWKNWRQRRKNLRKANSTLMDKHFSWEWIWRKLEKKISTWRSWKRVKVILYLK